MNGVAAMDIKNCCKNIEVIVYQGL